MMARLKSPAASVSLLELLAGIDVDGPITSMPILGVAANSRSVGEGFLFFARAGESHHGLDYLEAVVDAGVVCVIVDIADPRITADLRKSLEQNRVCLLALKNLAHNMGEICSRFYGHPSHAMSMVGITGTDGKTSVSQFVAKALNAIGAKSAVIGTLGNGIVDADDDNFHDTGLTTPDAVGLQTSLADFRDQNVSAVSMEVSSHALHQGRAGGVDFDVAVLTNLGRDHIDYHETLENYHAVKWSLLRNQDLSAVVANVDDPLVREGLAQVSSKAVFRYAAQTQNEQLADVVARSVRMSSTGLQFEIEDDEGRWTIKSSLIGRFNVENLLATFCVLRALGYKSATAASALNKLRAVPGRAESFTRAGFPSAVVDYSHTPQSLEAILRSTREHCEGELWCVFGCGGDRDKGKRPQMARAAESHSDHVIVTDDNPRTENGDAIVEDILKGFSDRSSILVERDRQKAIGSVMENAKSCDWVVIAGKGHEDYQIVGVDKLHLSDREIVADILLEASHGRA
ncbi:MAG: UDP-N-acetylmuramoyl-L-alanyl-D-glutamate--2,6-diaminopimelate ligase [Pseudomonadota bacterium]